MKRDSSQELFEYLTLHIDSVELLEILKILHAERRPWSLLEIDAAIRSSISSVENRLARLIQLGFINKNSLETITFKYQPHTKDLEALGDSLLALYQNKRVEVIERIYTKPLKEIVNFSNAFKFRKGEDDNG